MALPNKFQVLRCAVLNLRDLSFTLSAGKNMAYSLALSGNITLRNAQGVNPIRSLNLAINRDVDE